MSPAPKPRTSPVSVNTPTKQIVRKKRKLKNASPETMRTWLRSSEKLSSKRFKKLERTRYDLKPAEAAIETCN